MHCPDHPKYKGKCQIKRLATCEGCRKVRETYLLQIKERKKDKQPQQYSITTPGHRCGMAHLIAEIGTVILYGPQPAYFWRKETAADPRAKKHFTDKIKLLNFRFMKDQDLYNQVKGLMWLVWERDYNHHMADRLHEGVKEVNELAEELQHTLEKAEKVLEPSVVDEVKLNPFLHGDLLDAETEEK